MSRTMQNVVDRARIPLNDADKVGWTDPDLLAGANDALLVLRARRPDLFFGSYSSLPAAELVLGDPFPLPDEFFVPVCNYVRAWAFNRDDENAMRSLAKDFFDLFAGGL